MGVWPIAIALKRLGFAKRERYSLESKKTSLALTKNILDRKNKINNPIPIILPLLKKSVLLAITFDILLGKQNFTI